ncbi:uncharacterized protein LOC125579819 [Brassica napus]|uniref:uncharacterized protein LOC125579819 n=1 Tax=Brassica napus TaxID=3708 RepID=UPI0020789F89|nr:uncharacterized protein LOC125579819 [Brassica napus]
MDKARNDYDAWAEVNILNSSQVNGDDVDGAPIVKWEKPCQSFVKRNIDSSWINETVNTGVSWILRNNSGEPMMHSRRSFSSIPTKLEAELLSFTWAIDCLSDLRCDRVVFESSSYLAGEAILMPEKFLGYQDLLGYICFKLTNFNLWNISYVHLEGNRCAHEIALSVTRDHRYQSYIARGGPFWLRALTLEEATDDT